MELGRAPSRGPVAGIWQCWSRQPPNRRAVRGALPCRAPCRFWVGNVLDREACELTVTNNSPLFEQDLASMPRRHFQEVLEQQEQLRSAEDKEPEDEDMA